jgi:hypothetical protein
MTHEINGPRLLVHTLVNCGVEASRATNREEFAS